MFSDFLCAVRGATTLALLQVVLASASSDPVIAVVNGTKIHHRSAVELLLCIPPQAQGMSVGATLREEMITAEVLRVEMRRQKLDQDLVLKAQLAEMERYVLRRAYQIHVIEHEITDAALNGQYDPVVNDLPEREEIQACHILFRSESEAQVALADIQHGANSANVAREQSLDKLKEHEGDQGFLSKEILLESFAHATTALQPGQINEQPVQGPFS